MTAQADNGADKLVFLNMVKIFSKKIFIHVYILHYNILPLLHALDIGNIRTDVIEFYPSRAGSNTVIYRSAH